MQDNNSPAIEITKSLNTPAQKMQSNLDDNICSGEARPGSHKSVLLQHGAARGGHGVAGAAQEHKETLINKATSRENGATFPRSN